MSDYDNSPRVVNKIYVLNILSQNKAEKTTSEKKMRCGIMRVKVIQLVLINIIAYASAANEST